MRGRAWVGPLNETDDCGTKTLKWQLVSPRPIVAHTSPFAHTAVAKEHVLMSTVQWMLGSDLSIVIVVAFPKLAACGFAHVVESEAMRGLESELLIETMCVLAGACPAKRKCWSMGGHTGMRYNVHQRLQCNRPNHSKKQSTSSAPSSARTIVCAWERSTPWLSSDTPNLHAIATHSSPGPIHCR